MLEIDGKFYAQSTAILRLLGNKYGYYPQEPMRAWRIDSTLDCIGDLLNAYYKAAFAPVSEEEKKELFKAFYEGAFTKWVAVINKRVSENTNHKYIVGETLTIADFSLAAIAYSTFYNDANPSKDVQAEIVAKYPVAEAYFKGLGEILKEHLSTRTPSPW